MAKLCTKKHLFGVLKLKLQFRMNFRFGAKATGASSVLSIVFSHPAFLILLPVDRFVMVTFACSRVKSDSKYCF